MAHILIVDDDAEVLGTVSRALLRDGHEIAVSSSPAEARSEIDARLPDLIILDIMMPEQSGLSFCREIRADDRMSPVPILFLSAKGRTDDIVRGLDAGGDDYLPKPFEVSELNARVRALLRRRGSGSPSSTDIVEVGDLHLNPKTFQVTTSDKSNVQLTSTEYRLLHHLMQTPDQVLSVRDLLDAVWQYPPGTGDPDLVRAHIRNLRVKVEAETAEPRYIHTVHGVGYMVKS